MKLHKYEKPDEKGLRKFGITTGLIFIGLFGLLFPLWRHHTLAGGPRWPFYVGAPLVIVGLILPKALGPVHRGWMFIGGVLGWINTRIILTAVFFVLLTPIGLLMRLFGRDALGRRFQKAAPSYRRESTPLLPERLKEPF